MLHKILKSKQILACVQNHIEKLRCNKVGNQNESWLESANNKLLKKTDLQKKKFCFDSRTLCIFNFCLKFLSHTWICFNFKTLFSLKFFWTQSNLLYSKEAFFLLQCTLSCFEKSAWVGQNRSSAKRVVRNNMCRKVSNFFDSDVFLL